MFFNFRLSTEFTGAAEPATFFNLHGGGAEALRLQATFTKECTEPPTVDTLCEGGCAAPETVVEFTVRVAAERETVAISWHGATMRVSLQ